MYHYLLHMQFTPTIDPNKNNADTFEMIPMGFEASHKIISLPSGQCEHFSKVLSQYFPL